MISSGVVMCGGSGIVIEHEERCDDDETDEACPICASQMMNEFIERMQAAAAQPGQTMTPKEFSKWLRNIDTGSPAPQ